VSKGKPKETLQHLTRKPFQSIRACYEELQGTSDRACALVAVALLDQQLMTLLRTIMIDLNSEETDKLFYSYQSVFSTFSSKIMSAWAFGLITREERENMSHIRRIRNVFAHSVVKIGFKEPLITEECTKLIFPDLPGAERTEQTHTENPRFNFEKSVVSQYTRLVNEYAKFLKEKSFRLRRIHKNLNRKRALQTKTEDV